MWQDKKDGKISMKRAEKEVNELKGCTFKPDLSSLSNTAKKSLMLSSAGE